MSSANNKTSGDFSQAAQKLLPLTPDQITALDEMELEFFREYVFKGTERLTDRGLRIKYFRKFMALLSAEQLRQLKTVRVEAKIKRQKKQAEKEIRSAAHRRNRFERLEMDEETFAQFSLVLAQVHQEVKDQSMQHIKDGKEHTFNAHEYKLRQYKKHLDTALSQHQLELFFNIMEEEEKKMLEHALRTKKQEYHRHGIMIDDKQAEEILDYENKKSPKNADGNYFSKWEMMELEKQFFNAFLIGDQIEEYERWQAKRVEQIKAEKVKSDASNAQQVERSESYYRYFVANYLPVMCKRRAQLEELLTVEQKEKIAILRKVYNEKLNEQLLHTQKEHQRFNIGLAPNEYKLSELRIKQARLFPNAWYIKDDPRCKTLLTPAVEEFLSQPSAELTKAYEALQAFNISNYEAHGGQYGGWIHVVKPAPGEAYIGQVSTLLLHPEVEANLANANYTID